LGAFISSVEHQEKLVGSWEVGTPRRVVASKKFVGTQKKDFVVEPRVEWSGGLCFACNLSNLRGKLVGGWRKCTNM
jgi:hypothetical protein